MVIKIVDRDKRSPVRVVDSAAMRGRTAVSTGVAFALASLVLTASAPASSATILRGPAAAGGTWTLTADRDPSDDYSLSITISQALPRGRRVGHNLSATGPLTMFGGILTVHTRWRPAAALGTNLVGGVTVERARSVVVRFADRRRLRLQARRGPRAWRKALGSRVRYFAADASDLTSARPLSVAVFDGCGNRLAWKAVEP